MMQRLAATAVRSRSHGIPVRRRPFHRHSRSIQQFQPQQNHSIGISQRIALYSASSQSQSSLDSTTTATTATEIPGPISPSDEIPPEPSSIWWSSAPLDERVDFVLHKVQPGEMSNTTWQQARGLIPKCAQRKNQKNINNARMSQKVLDRLLEEASLQEHYRVNSTLVNICMDTWIKTGMPDACERVESIFQNMLVQSKAHPENVEPPDTISYNTYLNAWSSSASNHAPQKVEDIIANMEKLSHTHPDGAVHPDEWSYHQVLECYANRSDRYGAAKAAEDWLLRLSELGINDENKSDSLPSTFHFNAVLKAWANSNEAKGPERSHEILLAMLNLYSKGHENAKPDDSSFSTVTNAFAKRGTPASAEKAEEILTQMEELDLADTDFTSSLNSVINAWAKSGAPHAGEKADALLQKALSGTRYTPNVITYTSCVEAHAQGEKGPEQAEAFLHKMIAAFQSGEIDVSPHTPTFNRAISAWAYSKRSDGPLRAQALLQLMDELSSAHSSSFKCRPNLSSYSFCVDAWTRNESSADASTKALMLLHRMRDGNVAVKPDSFIYHNVIKGLARSSLSGVAGATTKVLEVFQLMEEEFWNGNRKSQPDHITCNIILSCLIREGNTKAAEKASELLDRMDEMYESGNTDVEPDSNTYRSVMETWVKSGDKQQATRKVLKLFDTVVKLDEDKNSRVRLDQRIFRLVFKLLSESNNTKEASLRAYRIFNKMIELHKRGDNSRYKDLCQEAGGCFSACLRAVAKGGYPESARRTQEIVTTIMQMYRAGEISQIPNKLAFGSAAVASFTSFDVDSFRNGEAIVNLMKDLAQNGHTNLQPDVSIYVSSITILARTRLPRNIEKAERILLLVEEERKRGALHVGADKVSWNSIINAWARSRLHDKSKRARVVLDKMKEFSKYGNRGVKPDEISFNTVLNAAAFTTGPKHALQEAKSIGLQTYEDFKQTEGIQPDDVTYLTMIKLYKYLEESKEEGLKGILSIFEECCSAGQVGKLTVKEMLLVLNKDQQKEVLGFTSEDYDHQDHRKCVPESWTENLREA